MNKITTEKIIKKLRKEYKDNIDIPNVVDALKKQGYDVVFFNTDEGDKIADCYGMTDILKRVNAITYSGTQQLVFVNHNLHEQDQLCLLLHELGHILLEHIGHGDTDLKNKRLMEMEAESFAYNVLNYNKPQYWQWLLAILSVVMLLTCGITYTKTKTPVNNVQNPIVTATPDISVSAAETDDTVYITRTGKAYHRKNCMYAKDKDCIALSRAEAEKEYSPCKYCNP